jgi:hydroxymethylglutaryl-CoA lyase
MSPLPATVAVREVGPRDGFQNENDWIPTPRKIEFIERLGAAGLKRIELTSFVRADVIPQLADNAEVLRAIRLPADVQRSVIIPTPRGLQAALEVRDCLDQVGVFLSASETHNQRNVNRSIAESLRGLHPMLADIRAAGLEARAIIATSFGCPYEGAIPVARVVDLARALLAAGAQEIAFGDSTGMANPVQVRTFFALVRDALGDDVELTAHFHNTRGQALANALGALDAGCQSFESSFGELGGCPMVEGATGNVATEDLVAMLHEMGVSTGVDVDQVIGAARDVQGLLGRALTSHTLTAGPVSWTHHAGDIR